MSGFFDSEMVRKSLIELDDLQEKIIDQLYHLPFADKEKKRGHLETMKEFLEKQKLFIFRMSLSDDPEAVEMKEKIIESAQLFGFKPGDDLNKFFEDMEETIDKLEETLDV
jgi:predicted transcriptional regulator